MANKQPRMTADEDGNFQIEVGSNNYVTVKSGEKTWRTDEPSQSTVDSIQLGYILGRDTQLEDQITKALEGVRSMAQDATQNAIAAFNATATFGLSQQDLIASTAGTESALKGDIASVKDNLGGKIEKVQEQVNGIDTKLEDLKKDVDEDVAAKLKDVLAKVVANTDLTKANKAALASAGKSPTCGAAFKVDNMNTDACKDTKSGSYCTVKCKKEYYAVFPSEKVYCGTGGSWPAVLPSCKPHENMKRLATGPNGSPRMNKEQAQRIGMSFAYPARHCDDIKDFRPFGDTNRGEAWIRLMNNEIVQVYCDNKRNGGGWHYVVKIKNNNYEHSNTGHNGERFPLIPNRNEVVNYPNRRTTDWGKYSDRVINLIMQGSPRRGNGKSEIWFECNGKNSFLKGCHFRATRGLGAPDACVVQYSNEAATSMMHNRVCNKGSQALGSHCSSPGGGRAFTYCSHCPKGDWCCAGRRGCGHDQWGYGRHGEVWVR
jgi:hypothetical protein